MTGGLWLGTWARFIVRNRLGPYVPTPHHVGKRLLQLAKVTKVDKVYDIGCGDGRLLIEAASRYGARGVGFELNADLVEEARSTVQRENLQDLVEIKHEDAKSADLTQATVVTMYLSEWGNLSMLPKLQRELAPGGRVATFTFPIKGLKPIATTQVDGIDLFVYAIP
ncbi:hypothetical protein CYMTET_21295 [Cymbomonas tetramitiformis]|uniref:Methyltransferase domain-containing protein n=1 Tax=Cymbomonas tetramitiformis TaxID=36881 RepID=A0AAE0L307_9CHLO|nr:hypothetical protein CYMTET_21295 [Cymbomonas tetramitiformis]